MSIPIWRPNCPPEPTVRTTNGLRGATNRLWWEPRKGFPMIARDLEALLASHSGYQRGEIDQRVRPLRDHNLIPYGPRGPNAPAMEPLHAALIVLTMVSRRAASSGEIAMRAMDLQLVPRPAFSLDGSQRLAAVLATGLSIGSSFLHRVEISSDGSLAWVTVVEKRKPVTFLFCDDAKMIQWVAEHPDTYEAQGGSLCNHRFVMSAAVIDQIKIGLDVGEDSAGYASRKVK